MFERAIANFRPRPRVRVLHWARANVQTADSPPRPYDHRAFPHEGAPGGPFDAFDCPQYLRIIKQFGSQVGKTFGVHCCLLKTADCDPCSMMAVLPNQKLAVEEMTTKVYPILERCPPLRDQLRPERLRKQDLVALKDCRIYVGWARSVSTLASKSIRVGYAGEVDKFEHTKTSKEADPLELFFDRFKASPRHKIICESTPAKKGTSRIERLRLSSTNCTFHVPCPHCQRYQTLVMGKDGEPGGLRWDKGTGGKSEKELARKTARYICLHCNEAILDHHRWQMMRLGVWVPEGCTVNDEKAREAATRWPNESQPWRGWSLSDWIDGTPARDGRDAGYHLSSLYALSLTWGDIAAKFIDTKTNPQNLRNFVNQWLAETWSDVKQEATWEQLGENLIDQKLLRFTVPEWASLVTIGVDAQEEGNRLPWIVIAWGPERKHAVIGYGEADGLADVETNLLNVLYDNMRPAATLIDSGNLPSGFYDFCVAMSQKGHIVLPCKGSSSKMEVDYAVSTLGENTSMPGMKLVRVDTIRTQSWLGHVLHSLKSDDPGGARLHAGSLETHQDFLEQILNDTAVLEPDKTNNDRESWKRIDRNVPNDFRDAWRYAYAAMLLATRNQPIKPRIREAVAKTKSAVVSSGIGNRSGGSWL